VYAYVGGDPIKDPDGLGALDRAGNLFAGFGDTLTTIPFTNYYLPIGQFSPVLLKSVRFFHVLESHELRQAAHRYIR
jgi:hypothetical protein